MYCIEVWVSTTNGNLVSLLKLQKRVLRIIKSVPTRTDSTPLFLELGILSVFKMYMMKLAVVIFKSYHGLSIKLIKELLMAWRHSGYKPLSEPMMVSLPTQIGVTQPQWINCLMFYLIICQYNEFSDFIIDFLWSRMQFAFVIIPIFIFWFVMIYDLLQFYHVILTKHVYTYNNKSMFGTCNTPWPV